jgi:tetratricopeptide (TPR) repeat protein
LNLDPGDELKKAAFLVDHNSEIFMEVGKLFLSRWDQLSQEDRSFGSSILRKIMESKNRQKLQNIFHVWEINIKDYDVLDQILPEDSFIFRRMAEYLGERGLFLENRQRLLSEAEYLEFEEAKSIYRAGEMEFYRFNLIEASKRFRSCLNVLDIIRFYQKLIQQNLIDDTGFIQIRKSSYLYLAKCSIEENRGLPLDAKEYLKLYLNLEQDVGAISELEKYLIERRILDKKLDNDIDKMDHLALHLILALKQKKYSDIIRVGRIIRASSIVVTDEMKDDYIKILLILGEAFYKADFIYDADDYYQRAYELNPQNLNTHLKMVQNYERLGNHQDIQRISERLERILYPKNSSFAIQLIKKGDHRSRKMVLDGREIILDLHFNSIVKEVQPIVAVYFNSHVVWEDFLEENVLSLNLKSRIGENRLQVIAVNKDLYIDKMIYSFVE